MLKSTQSSSVPNSSNRQEMDAEQEHTVRNNDSVESSNQSNNCYSKSRGRSIANGVVVFAIITPLVVMFWKGTWGIMDLFIFPLNVEKSAWTCAAFGLGVIFMYMNLQQDLIQILQSCSLFKKAVVFIWFLFVYVLACSVVASWRGVWYILDYYFTSSSLSALVTHIVGVAVLCSTDTFTTVISAPGFINRDWDIQPLTFNLVAFSCFPPLLSTSKLSLFKMFLDCFVTAAVIGISTISYWRGTWTLLINFYPKVKINSTSLCLAVGHVVVLCCYCFNDILQTKLEFYRFDKFAKFIQFLFSYFLAFGVVNIWKGFWGLIDILSLLLPGQPVSTVTWSCHVAGFTFLSLMKASINLVGSPAGCRICSSTSLAGFEMGSFLDPPREIEIAHAPLSVYGSVKKVVRETKV